PARPSRNRQGAQDQGVRARRGARALDQKERDHQRRSLAPLGAVRHLLARGTCGSRRLSARQSGSCVLWLCCIVAPGLGLLARSGRTRESGAGRSGRMKNTSWRGWLILLVLLIIPGLALSQ